MRKFIQIILNLPFLQCQSRLYHTDKAVFWRQYLFACFWISLAFFPIGYGFREVMPPLCLIFLLLWYRHAWPDSTLHRMGYLRWLFFCAACMIICGVVFSINPFSSFLHAATGLNKAYILPFIAMECARDLKDLKRLCWALVFACFWEGLDGLWQAFTGLDFIMGYPHYGRLTGSLGDYTIGNLLALSLVPAFGCFAIFRKASLSALSAAFLVVALLWPAFFLFLGASSRSGLLAVAGSLLIWGLMRYGICNRRWLLLPALAVTSFLCFQGYRFSPQAVLDDNRWDLWGLAWQVFEAHPWFGAGAGQYNEAFRLLDLAPAREVITISHPHNLYLDMLYAHGIIGFTFGMISIAGFAGWLIFHIQPRLKILTIKCPDWIYWQLTAWFALGYLAWLINGIFGHDFYRIWWLALAMCNLGIAAGAVINAPFQKVGSSPAPLYNLPHP